MIEALSVVSLYTASLLVGLKTVVGLLLEAVMVTTVSFVVGVTEAAVAIFLLVRVIGISVEVLSVVGINVLICVMSIGGGAAVVEGELLISGLVANVVPPVVKAVGELLRLPVVMFSVLFLSTEYAVVILGGTDNVSNVLTVVMSKATVLFDSVKRFVVVLLPFLAL